MVIKFNFCSDFEHMVEAGVWSVFCCWCLEEVMKLNLGRDSEARFDQYQRFAQILGEKNICEKKAIKSYGSYLSIGGNRDNISYKNKNITFLLSIIVCCQGHN